MTRVRRPPARFWTIAETLAVAAGIIPFFASAARSTVETVNGEVVRFAYSDGVALAGGVGAIVFALVAVARLRVTAPAMRPLRVLLAVAFVGLGVLQLVRGTGAFQSPRLASRDRDAEMDRMWKQQPSASASAAPADLDARARTVFELWQAGKADVLLAMAATATRTKTDANDLADAMALWNAALGPCTRWATPLAFRRDDGAWRARGDVRCAARAATFEIAFVIERGEPVVRDVQLTPDDLPMPARAAFDAMARRMADLLAAGDLAGLAGDLVPALRRKLGPLEAKEAELADMLADAGKIRAIEQTEATPTKRGVDYTFAVRARKHPLRIQISIDQLHGRLFATAVFIGPVPTR